MGRNILLIGIGQTGCAVAELFSRAMQASDIACRALAFDTDKNTLSKLAYAMPIPLVDSGDLESVIERLGEDDLKEWFPCDWETDRSEFIKRLDMQRGSNQWRMKALLSFASFLSDEKRLSKLYSAINYTDEEVELYTVASLAGGSGSGLLLPITFFIKRYLEEKGVRIVCSRGVLTLPDIYQSCYSSEQMVKANANAYSALRELNAVNTALLDADGVLHPPVRFKINAAAGSASPLFDALDRSGPVQIPFDQVFLFERVPGIFSAEGHMSVVADAIASLCRSSSDAVSEASNKRTTSVFGGISLTKVRYPKDSIEKYIIKKHLECFVCDELGAIANIAEHDVQRQLQHARNYGMRTPNELEAYCSAFEQMIDSTAHEPEILMGRYALHEPSNSSLPYDILGGELADKVRCAVYASIKAHEANGKAPASIRMAFNPAADPETGKVTPLRETFPCIVEDCRELMNTVYHEGVKHTEQPPTALRDMAISGSDDGGEMLFDLVLKVNGEFVHPGYALARMCRLYNDLKYAANETALDMPDYRYLIDSIPAELLDVNPSGKRSGYTKLGKSRFRQLMGESVCDAFDEACGISKSEDKLLSAALKDRSTFADDLDTVYDRIVSTIAKLRFGAIRTALGHLIERYRDIASTLVKRSDDFSVELRLAARASSEDSSTVTYIGSSVAEKLDLYDKYMESLRSDGERVNECDATLGEYIYTILSEDEKDRSVDKLLVGLEEILREYLRGSDFYQNKIEKNIIEAITDGGSGLANGRIFVGKNVPLSMSNDISYSDRRRSVSSVTAILPDCIRGSFAEYGLLAEDETPEEFVEKLMYESGEYLGKAVFSSELGPYEMQVRRDLCGMPLYAIAFADDGSSSSEGYISLTKALRVSREQVTPLWNPHLTYSRSSQYLLPFISSKRQEAYISSVAAAVIMSLMDGSLTLTQNEEGEYVYCSNDGVDAVILEGPIMSGEVSKLLDHFAGRAGVEEASERLEAMLRMARHNSRCIKAQLGSEAEMPNKSKSISSVRRAALELIREITAEKAMGTEKYLDHLIGILLETVIDRYEAFKLPENSRNELCGAFCDMLKEWCVEFGFGSDEKALFETVSSRAESIIATAPNS